MQARSVQQRRVNGPVIIFYEITEHCQFSFLVLCDYTSAYIRCQYVFLIFSKEL